MKLDENALVLVWHRNFIKNRSLNILLNDKIFYQLNWNDYPLQLRIVEFAFNFLGDIFELAYIIYNWATFYSGINYILSDMLLNPKGEKMEGRKYLLGLLIKITGLFNIL